ncbi:hypothetical protein [Endozoicomonas lisbonensis]|uniref:Ricin B lectin domain-containing protein n=1 Tax=Endozoicomonas lisbonensis TaxID=3120522 RepID=A0ABV2SCL8_9GAMM
MKNALLFIWALLLLPCAYAADCLDQDCDEGSISLDECLDDRFRIPSGPYIKQRCGDDADCIHRTFSYDAELDELSFFSSDSYYRVNTHSVSNICKLKKQGFQFNMKPEYGYLGTTHPHATIRYIGTNDKETRILSGNGAVAENERTLIERWIMEPENHFQKGCINIRYYPSEDMLTADCFGYEREAMRSNQHISTPKVTTNTAIPYISLYNDNNHVLVNDDGMLRANLLDKSNFLATAQKHSKISNLCQSWNAEHKHFDGYEVCDSNVNIPVHNCNAEETVYDEIHDTLFVRCTNHKGVYHLQNAKTCQDQNYDIHLEEEYRVEILKWYSQTTRVVVVGWKGLSCRVNKTKFFERYGL